MVPLRPTPLVPLLRIATAMAIGLVLGACDRPPEPASSAGADPASPEREASPEPEASPAPVPVREADPARDPQIADPATPAVLGEDVAYPCAEMVNRAVVARRIEDREPVGTQGPFEANGEPLHVFLELNNPNTEARVTVRWFHDGTQHQFGQDITAGVSPSWRTWVRHRILPEQTGRWRVEVFAPGECLAARLQFDGV